MQSAIPPDGITITSPDLDAVEVAWFSALCGDDARHLGVLENELRSSFAHCSEIVKTADRLGFDNILLPNSYVVGQEPIPFAAAVATLTEQIQLLVALRMAETHPPMLARAIATLDHLLRGRLTINIISSDLPGTRLASAERYQRSNEVVQILKQAWTRERIEFEGDFYQFDLPTDPVKPFQQNGGPLLYFGGISPPARELCAEHCDVFLMWPETEDNLLATMRDMSARAAAHGRTVDFGLRIHVIVRDTESDARAAADQLICKLDDDTADALKHRSQDSKSAGVLRQDALRDAAGSDWLEPGLWGGIGRARSGCASAIVGDPGQVREKIQRYIDMGMRSFIFSGYPHIDECELFAEHVLPSLKQCRLPEVYGRVVPDPVTPLTTAPRTTA